MSSCGKCSLERIYKQFAKKQAEREAAKKVVAAQPAPEVIAVKEPGFETLEVKRVKTRKKKEPITETVDASAEENNSEVVEK